MSTYPDFIKSLAKELKMPQAEAKATASAFIKTIQHHIKHGESVSLQGLGTFAIKKNKKGMTFGFTPHAQLERCLHYAASFDDMMKAADDLGLPKLKSKR